MQGKKTKRLYHKMFCTYTLIVLCIVTALTLYFISDSKNRLLETNRTELGRISAQALAYIEETGRTADYIHKDLYRSPSELEDLLAYFRLEPGAYQEYSLRRYMASFDLVYKGNFRFLNETFEAYGQLEKIELISYQNFQMTECYPEKNVYPGKDGRLRMKEIQNDAYCEKGHLVYLKEIRHPDTLKPAGCILFTFRAQKELEDICMQSPYANMVVLYGDDSIIFQKTEKKDYKRMLLSKQVYVYSESAQGHQVYTFMDERRASQIPAARLFLFLAVGAAVSAAGIFYIHCYAKRLTSRVNLILNAMNHVMAN